MSVVAGTPSTDGPNARLVTTFPPRVTLTITALRCPVSIALRTTSAMADAVAPGGAAAGAGGAADATDGPASESAASTHPATRWRRPRATPYLLLGMTTTPLRGLGGCHSMCRSPRSPVNDQLPPDGTGLERSAAAVTGR